MTRARDLASGFNGVRPFATAAGSTSVVALSAGASSGPITVTYPASRFSVGPVVAVINVSSDQTGIAALSSSATGFTLYVRNLSSLASGDMIIRWTATQMTPTSGEG